MPLKRLLRPKSFSMGDGDRPIIACNLTIGLSSIDANNKNNNKTKTLNKKLKKNLLSK